MTKGQEALYVLTEDTMYYLIHCKEITNHDYLNHKEKIGFLSNQIKEELKQKHKEKELIETLMKYREDMLFTMSILYQKGIIPKEEYFKFKELMKHE